MDDETVLQWLMGMTTYIATEHSRLKTLRQDPARSNAGPNLHEKNVYEAFDEGFCRWMGWRGEDDQDREIHEKRAADPNSGKRPFRRAGFPSESSL